MLLKKKKIYSPILSPGDVAFHHCNIIHQANKNNHKTLERKALALTIYSYKSKVDKKLLKKYLKIRPDLSNKFVI